MAHVAGEMKQNQSHLRNKPEHRSGRQEERGKSSMDISQTQEQLMFNDSTIQVLQQKLNDGVMGRNKSEQSASSKRRNALALAFSA